MKIALLTSVFPLSEKDESGFPATWELARALKDQGHDVLVLTLGGADQPDVLRTEVHGIRVMAAKWDANARKTLFDGVHSFGVFSWQIARARIAVELFRQELEQFGPDVIESQEFNALGFFYGAERKYPFVVRCYGPMSLLMRSGEAGYFAPSDVELTEAMELATIAAADGIVSICQDLAQRMSDKTGRTLSDFAVIRTPLTVPPTEQLPVAPVHEGAVQPRLFYWGRVEQQKGADLLVEALPYIAQKYPNVRLRIGGKEMIPAGGDQPYGNVMRARLKELGLAEHVDFLGFLSREEIAKEAREADVCLFPSKYETACYTCLEAIIYGGIPVAAKVGGLPEYHKHGDSAWLVEPFSPKALAEGVLAVVSDRKLQAHMKAVGRDYIRQVCDPQEVARQSVAVYERAIESFKRTQQSFLPAGARPDLAYAIFASRLSAALPDGSIHEYIVKSIETEMDRAYKNGREAALAEQPKTVGTLVWAAARMTKRLVTGRRQ